MEPSPSFPCDPPYRWITLTGTQLTMVCRRLEAATSRLEDMATSVDASHPSTVAAIHGANAATPGGQPVAPTPPPAPTPEPLPRTVEEFDKIIDEDVKAFVTASEKIGGLVEEQVCGISQFSQMVRYVNITLT